MPGRDKTGPMGQGSMTGGGFGFCYSDTTQGSETPAERNMPIARGQGLGAGRGQGFGNGRNAGRGRGNCSLRGRGRVAELNPGKGLNPVANTEINIQPVGDPVYLDEN